MDYVQTLLDVADGGVKYKTEKLPKVKIKSSHPFPSLILLSSIAITFVLLFCVFSTVQVLRLKTEIYECRKEKIECETTLNDLEGKATWRYSKLRSYTQPTQNN